MKVVDMMKHKLIGILSLPQVDHLKEDLATQYQLYRDERDARKLLITRISTMQSTQDTEHDDDNKGCNEGYTSDDDDDD